MIITQKFRSHHNKTSASASLGCDNDEWWVGADVVSAEDEEHIPEENVFEEDVFVKDEFEGRELSVVLEETEAEETCSEYESSTVDEVLFCSFHIVLSCVFFNYYPYYPR